VAGEVVDEQVFAAGNRVAGLPYVQAEGVVEDSQAGLRLRAAFASFGWAQECDFTAGLLQFVPGLFFSNPLTAYHKRKPSVRSSPSVVPQPADGVSQA
jgi:hypothetical protein